MADHNRKDLAISQLLLDTQNPRYEELAGQDAALKEMLDRQGNKLVNLADDIVKHGLSPSDLPIVTPADAEGQFVVLEGNRRVAALKALLSPTLIKLASDGTVRRRLEKLSAGFAQQPISTLDCIVFPSREAAAHWLELRHRGENQGVGVVQWDAQATDRFRERLTGEASPEKQVLEFVKTEGQPGPDLAERLDDLPLSSLKRLVGDPDVRRRLGISKESGKVRTLLKKDEVLKGLTTIVRDLLLKKITVTDIKRKKDRADYIKQLPADDLPDLTQVAGGTWALDEPEKLTKVRRPTKKPKKPAPPSTARLTLIPKPFTLSIQHPRLNDIYHELRSLNVDKFTNSAAVMLRVFLELSLDEFGEKEKGVLRPSDKLNKKLLKAADHLEKTGSMEKRDLKAVRNAASKKDDLFSTDTLHAYVHNPKIQPIAKDLKTTWNNMQSFVEMLHR